MINRNMKFYDYYLYGDINSYGQPQLSAEVQGTIKMSISITSQAVQDNIQYKNATYLGLTFAPVDDKYVIQYGDRRLKVLYVNNAGRMSQVFMSEM